VKRSGSAPAAVRTAVTDARTRLNTLRRHLGLAQDGQGGGGGGAGGQQAVRNTISQVKGQIILSTSAPTEMQIRAVRDAREDLAKVIDDTNSIISTVMPGLYRTLADNNLQPAPLKPLRAITSSGIR